MIKAIIFDADGVVTTNKTLRFSDRLHRDYNVPIEKMIPFFKNEFLKCQIGQADLKIEIQKYFKDWNWTKSLEELLAYWFEEECTVNTHMLESIHNLTDQGILCYLATSNEKYRTEYLASTLGLQKHFLKIFSTASVGEKKEDPKFWEKIFEQLPDLQKQEILVWDDDMKNIESARSFGFQAEIYTDFESYMNFCKIHINSFAQK